MSERLTDDTLTSLFLASLDDDRAEQVTQVRPVTVRRMVTELRERRAADLTSEEREALAYVSQSLVQQADQLMHSSDAVIHAHLGKVKVALSALSKLTRSEP